MLDRDSMKCCQQKIRVEVEVEDGRSGDGD